MCVISWSLFVTVASLLASFAVRGTTSRWIRLDKEYWWHFISGLIYSDTEPTWGNVVIDILQMFVGVKYLFSRSFPEERDFFCIKKSIGFSNSLISWCKICAWYKPTSVQWRNKATSHFTSLQFLVFAKISAIEFLLLITSLWKFNSSFSPHFLSSSALRTSSSNFAFLIWNCHWIKHQA